MNTRATPTREGERRARLLAAGATLGGVSTRSSSTSPSDTRAAASTSVTSNPSSARDASSGARSRSQAAMADLNRQDVSADGSGAVSSFYLSQNPRPRRGRRSSAGSSSAHHQASGQATGGAADLSMLTNASEEADDGPSFTREVEYANRLDASAAHIGQLLRKRTSRPRANGKGKQRQSADADEYRDDSDPDEDEDEEMSDPTSHKRKHGHRSTPNGRVTTNPAPSNASTPFKHLDQIASSSSSTPFTFTSTAQDPPSRPQRWSQRLHLPGPATIVSIVITLWLLTQTRLFDSTRSDAQSSPSGLASITRTTSRLASRLSMVESQIARMDKVQGQQSTSLNALTGRVASLELSKRETDELVRSWKDELALRLTPSEAELGKWKIEVQSALLEERQVLRSEMARLQAEWDSRMSAKDGDARRAAAATDASKAALKSALDRNSKYDAELARLSERLQVVESDLSKTRRELADLDVQSAAAQARADEALRVITEDPTSWLAQYLPALVPVRWEHVGQGDRVKSRFKTNKAPRIRIDEAFWTDMRAHFVSQDEARAMVDAGPSRAGTPAPALKPADVLRAVSPDLKELASQEARRAVESSVLDGVLLDRTAFMVLLEKEIRQASAALEGKIQAASKSLENEKLERAGAVEVLRTSHNKLADAVAAIEADRVAAKDGSRWSFWRSGNPAIDGDIAGLEADATGSNSIARVIELIDEALETYSQDKLGRPDYALYSMGARVIPSLTSQTYGQALSRPPSRPRLWSWPLRGRSGSGASPNARDESTIQGRGRPPVTALHPDLSPGMCWAFSGSKGTLGVELAAPGVRVSHITIEHAPARLLSSDDATSPQATSSSALGSAPRRVQVWGRVVGDSITRARVQAFTARQAADDSRLRARKSAAAHQAGDNDNDNDLRPAGTETGHWIRLGRFEYQLGQAGATLSSSRRSPRAHPHIQTFAIDPAVAALDIVVDAVQVGILSNHGNKEYTCLYRVRVHGEPEDDKGTSDWP